MLNLQLLIGFKMDSVPNSSHLKMIRFLKVGLGKLKSFDRLDLLPGIQSFGTGTGTVEDCMASIQLKLVTNCIQAFLSVLIPAVLYPPANTV